MTLHVYNTLTKRKEEFVPLEPGRVRMYNCGPTVYSFAHIGNFATFLLSDLLRRHLESSGVRVLQVMNITDVGHLTDDSLADGRGEDKLERKAREERKDPWQIARFYEEAFQRDRVALNLLPAHHYPRATEHIPEMIELIGELLRKGLAYEVEGQVYFSIAKFPQYGMLSGNTPEELVAGARVEEDPLKKDPLDFCLWKKDPRHLMQWDSPWGRGFPGWHIECSAMSRKYLGPIFDIHTGGEDNIFPHHDCEIAQSSGGEGRIFARFWLHRRHILVDGKKMSKREGNFYTVHDLEEKGFKGPEIRYALMSGHYRAKLNFTLEGLEAAREAIRRMGNFLDDMRALPSGGGPEEAAAVVALAAQADRGFRGALDDDLNISEALSSVFGFIRDVNKSARTRAAGEEGVRRLLAWDSVLGLGLADAMAGRAVTPGSAPTAAGPEKAQEGGRLPAAEIERLLAEREEARKRKDFRRADEIRKSLADKGIAIKDSPQGTRWTYS
jgi:cysteinyl-tRNA synthetase